MDQILHYLTVLSFNDTISGERTGFIVPVSHKLYSVLSSIPAHKSTIPKSEKNIKLNALAGRQQERDEKIQKTTQRMPKKMNHTKVMSHRSGVRWRWARAAPWTHRFGGGESLCAPPGDQAQQSADVQTKECDMKTVGTAVPVGPRGLLSHFNINSWE